MLAFGVPEEADEDHHRCADQQEDHKEDGRQHHEHVVRTVYFRLGTAEIGTVAPDPRFLAFAVVVARAGSMPGACSLARRILPVARMVLALQTAATLQACAIVVSDANSATVADRGVRGQNAEAFDDGTELACYEALARHLLVQVLEVDDGAVDLAIRSAIAQIALWSVVCTLA